MTPTQKLDALYSMEINHGISAVWDSGYTIELGDEINKDFGGIHEIDYCHHGFENAVNALWGLAKKHYPAVAEYEKTFTEKESANAD